MEAEIIGFERRPVQDQVRDEKSGELVVKTFEIGLLTLRCAVPKSLPVGQLVEVVVKPKRDKEEG